MFKRKVLAFKCRKGIASILFVGLIVLGLVLALFLVKGVIAKPGTSLTNPSAGYDKKTCPDLGVLVGGYVNVEDSAIFDLEPSLKEIKVDEVKVNNQNLLAWGQEPFTYEVKAFDNPTNNKLGQFSASGILTNADNQGIDKPYSITFTLPDMNCDKRVDDFDLRLEAELKGADIGEVAKQTRLLRFRNGGIQK